MARKLLSLLVICLFSIAPLQAQQSLTAGLSVGTGHAIKRTEWSDPNTTFGRTNLLTPWWAGVYVQKSIVNGVFIGADFQYTQSRFRISDYYDKTLTINKYQYLSIGPYAGFRLWKWVNLVGSLNNKILLASQRAIVIDARRSIWYSSVRLNVHPINRVNIDIGYEGAMKNFATVGFAATALGFYYNDTYFLTLKYALVKK
jgi:hypothetical protein